MKSEKFIWRDIKPCNLIADRKKYIHQESIKFLFSKDSARECPFVTVRYSGRHTYVMKDLWALPYRKIERTLGNDGFELYAHKFMKSGNIFVKITEDTQYKRQTSSRLFKNKNLIDLRINILEELSSLFEFIEKAPSYQGINHIVDTYFANFNASK